MNKLKRKSDAADYASHDFDQGIHTSQLILLTKKYYKVSHNRLALTVTSLQATVVKPQFQTGHGNCSTVCVAACGHSDGTPVHQWAATATYF